mgnify:CR=1 FL=1
MWRQPQTEGSYTSQVCPGNKFAMAYDAAESGLIPYTAYETTSAHRWSSSGQNACNIECFWHFKANIPKVAHGEVHLLGLRAGLKTPH